MSSTQIFWRFEIQNEQQQHTTTQTLKSNWWDEEMRYVHSPPSSLSAHIIFPSCMTRASSQLIYAAFYFLWSLRRSWKTPPLIFLYLSFSVLHGSCCLLVVVKGDVDCKAMFNVVCVCTTPHDEIHYFTQAIDSN